MSSWERGRGIPWELIPQDSTDLDDQKEMIHRQLQREAYETQPKEQQLQQPLNSQQNDETTEADTATQQLPTALPKQQPRFPYSNMDLLKQAAFGGCIGTITGGVFGVLDGMRAVGESPVIKNASDMAKARYILQGTTHKATLFGVYFGGFHILKYGLRVASNDELGPYSEIAIAAPVSLAVLSYKPTWRTAMPYATMLVVMDAFNIYMRRN
ncbi:hypothetical protein ACA910_010737 [Epithemia clementina (nom. ined.)]